MNFSGGGRGLRGRVNSASATLIPKFFLSSGLNGDSMCIATVVLAATPRHEFLFDFLRDDSTKLNGHGVTELAHVLRPRTIENKLIREGLHPRGFSHTEITNFSRRKRDHVLATGNTVISSLEGFGGLIERRTCMTNVRSGARLKDLIGNGAGFSRLRIWQITESIAHGDPRYCIEQRSLHCASLKARWP